MNHESQSLPQIQSLRSTKPALTRAADFDELWQQTRIELAAIDAAIERHQQGDCEEGLCRYHIQFQSLGNAPIQGYLLAWQDDRPRPLIVHTHGYQSRTRVVWDWARRGMHVLGFDTRGFGRSHKALPDLAPEGYVVTGIERASRSILRGAVCDYIRACEVGAHLLQLRMERLVCFGRSFAGGLALMAEAVRPQADVLAIGVPTFGWAAARRRLVTQGSGREINDYLQANPQQEQRVMHTLSYFDSMNFADHIRCPSLIGVGLQDPVVPAQTVYAIINHLQCPYEVRELPFSHTGKKQEEALWQRFDEQWLKMAAQGVSADFGSGTILSIEK